MIGNYENAEALAADALMRSKQNAKEISQTKQQISELSAQQGLPETNYLAEIGANLFDKNKVTTGYYISDTTGDLVANAAYSASDYFVIEPGAVYVNRPEVRHAYYDSNKSFISGFNGGTSTAPANAMYARTSCLNNSLNSFMFCKISLPQVYQPYWYNLPWLRVDKTNIDSIPTLKAFDFGTPTNLFNAAAATDGYYVESANGTLSSNATYWVSEFIPVKASQQYKKSGTNRYALYDKNYQYISGGNHTDTFTTGITAAYVRISDTPLTKKATYMLVEGATLPETYTPFGVTVPWLNPSASILSNLGISKYYGKTAVCSGDSNTYGTNAWPATLAAVTGMTVINAGFSAGRISVDTSSAIKQAFSLYNLVYAITHDDWTIPDTIIGQAGYENQAAQLAILKTIDWTNIDFWFIDLGTNDMSSQNPIVDTTDYDTATVPGALRYCVKEMLTAYPQLRIIVCTPIYRYWLVDTTIVGDGDDYIPATGTYTLTQLVDKLKTTAKELKLPVCDMYNELGINKHNRTNYLTDGMHINAAGHVLKGNKAAGALLSLY